MNRLSSNRLLIALSGDTTGRLFKYDIATKQVTLLLSELSGPAGVALSKDKSYLLITEAIGRRIRRFWLEGAKANSSDVFATVQGNPDNIKRTASGDFWVAVVSVKPRLIIIPTITSTGQRINQLGEVVETRDFTAQYNSPNGITEVQEQNDRLYIGSLDQNFIGSKLQFPLQTVGPESVAFDRKGVGPYTGVADGRIVTYHGPNSNRTRIVESGDTSGRLFKYDIGTKQITSLLSGFSGPVRVALSRDSSYLLIQCFGKRSRKKLSVATKERCDGKNGQELQQICGRPFGLGFYYKTGDLYITDAYYGLVVVRRGGLVTQRVTSFDGRRFAFLDALDIDQKNGVVYFADSGAIFKTGNRTRIIESRDTSGRLFKYDIGTKQVTLLLSGLSGPVGVALSKDSSYVLITEYIAQRIRRFWLKDAKANSSDVFTNVDRTPANIKTTVLGDFGWLLPTRNNILHFQ
ncbi:hypothetical protein HAX54_007054 [Datura stramonium]|uniref:Strictosidine synthase conserved region domain-containing protein n=1 Tax=Datura stramonium TaxID=4076 RepID=A0ABS8TDR5_DATST|nr:hypothetical protein [Datura stramonium]